MPGLKGGNVVFVPSAEAFGLAGNVLDAGGRVFLEELPSLIANCMSALTVLSQLRAAKRLPEILVNMATICSRLSMAARLSPCSSPKRRKMFFRVRLVSGASSPNATELRYECTNEAMVPGLMCRAFGAGFGASLAIAS